MRFQGYPGNSELSMTFIRPVILSGGSGTRLWPLSRRKDPKQFAQLVGEECLFAGVLKTVADRTKFAAPIIIGNIEHKFLIEAVLERLNIRDARIYLEPMGRNTAPAAILAAVTEEDAQALHLVMPSDHVIADKNAFYRAVEMSAPAAQGGRFVLFGIKPSRPETGFGYILPASDATASVHSIASFHEKPVEGAAIELIAKGALWNSGIFFYQPRTLINEAAAFIPNCLHLCRLALKTATGKDSNFVLGEESYSAMESHAFDRAIMEKTTYGSVVPCDMGWSDLGAWQALWQIADKDESQNAKIGHVVAKDVEGSYLRSYGPTLAVMGVKDVTVVATKDSVLVMPLSRAQDVKDLVDDLGDVHEALTHEHPRVVRPWGTYESIARGEGFQVKHITVLPGRSLSLQMHHHRAEHWVVVAGMAKVECDGEEKLVFPNQSVYVPSRSKHRLSNPGQVNLQLIEVQSGDYLGEDDIVRFEDQYGRVTTVAPDAAKTGT
ncbi:MAG: mannose-1-phosphate guanylyltransferase/mannose-6-phosphate isomerase [Alphaproteobacteria bacterium]|nr:mannose-1-phosphate guanylyltransferase/mannose-6-phosphate isomerase [Alphaproteobacteria bacterium]